MTTPTIIRTPKDGSAPYVAAHAARRLARRREGMTREQARALGVEQLALFDSAGETW